MSLELNCANFYDENKGALNLPPKRAKRYPTDINRSSVKKTIEEVGNNEKLVLNAYDGPLVKEGFEPGE